MTTYNKQGEELVEVARMEKPDDYKLFNLNTPAWQRDQLHHQQIAYDAHIASLSRIPILPGSVWPKTENLQQGIDFVCTAKFISKSGVLVAIPIPSTDITASEDKLRDWLEAYDDNRMCGMPREEAINNAFQSLKNKGQ